MAGTWTQVKIKVNAIDQEKVPQSYERSDETDWVPTAEKMPAAYELAAALIGEVIHRLVERSWHNGFSPYTPVPKITSITWRIFSRNGKLIKGGRYTELSEGDPPIAFMTPLPTTIDDALKTYHEARNKDQQPPLPFEER